MSWNVIEQDFIKHFEFSEWWTSLMPNNKTFMFWPLNFADLLDSVLVALASLTRFVLNIVVKDKNKVTGLAFHQCALLTCSHQQDCRIIPVSGFRASHLTKPPHYNHVCTLPGKTIPAWIGFPRPLVREDLKIIWQ